MSTESRDTVIVVPGKKMNGLTDFYCHEQLGGCGCVFKTSNEPIVTKDWEGDTISSVLYCPNKECGLRISVEMSSTYGTKMVTYGRVGK